MSSETKKLKKNSSQKPVLVAIFAHPDDESFGPGGTIFKYSKTHDVYILCATKGEIGGTHKKLAQIRAKELKNSAKILGAKKVFFLGFYDGTLSNSKYHNLAKKIEIKLKELKPEIVITFEQKGVSGHLDHIAVSMITTYVVKELNFIKELLYFCVTKEKRKKFGDYFIYFPPGYEKKEIEKTIDISDVWDIKVKAMLAHKSQLKDAKKVLNTLEKTSKEEDFLLFKDK